MNHFVLSFSSSYFSFFYRMITIFFGTFSDNTYFLTAYSTIPINVYLEGVSFEKEPFYWDIHLKFHHTRIL
jgi:hypothetical protein